MKPDPGWLPFLKYLYGFLLLLLISILAAVLALGHVEEKTSYGLKDIITGLLMISNAFAVWFAKDEKPASKEPEVPNADKPSN